MLALPHPIFLPLPILQTWKYVEGMHSTLQELFTQARKAKHTGVAMEEKKLLNCCTAYKDIHTSLKRELYGEKGTV